MSRGFAIDFAVDFAIAILSQNFPSAQNSQPDPKIAAGGPNPSLTPTFLPKSFPYAHIFVKILPLRAISSHTIFENG